MDYALIIEGANEVFTGGAPIEVADPVIAVEDGKIAYVGARAHLNQDKVSDNTERFSALGQLITPGLVDPHTHVVFSGDRSGEYAMRSAGKGYLEIAKAGGGIAATMRATRQASVDELVTTALPRLDRLLANGVTTAEVKSGYGLSFESEIRILEAIKALNARHPIDLVATFLGAHTVPPEYKERRSEYVREVTERMIPEVSRRGLAEFCDVFVEESAFSLEEAELVFRVGLEHGLRPKVHADQLSAGGGSELAARLGAVSADHLEHISDAGIAAMAESDTVAVLLPGAALFLNQQENPPARKLLDAGVRVALATDCNPGTCMSESLLLMLTLGMSRFGMSPSEVLDAVTAQAAKAIGREDRAGQISVGRPADLAIFDVPTHQHLPYHFGVPHTTAVFKGGQKVYGA